MRVVAFNVAEGWSRDMSGDVAREVLKEMTERGVSVAAGSRRLLARYVADRDLLRLENS